MFGMSGSSNGSRGDDPNMPTIPGVDGLPMRPSHAVPPMPPGEEAPIPADDMPVAPPPMPPQSPPPPQDNQSDSNLIQLKQQALQSLAPLVNQLEQTPEERFKTTMMMLQASDNPALVKDAYAAANQITDEKLRAQALLDVVNEINYFTQQKPPGGEVAASS